MKINLSRFVFLCFVAVSSESYAIYDANITGIVTQVVTYDYSDQVLIKLNNQPTSHPACSPSYFAIAGVPDARLKVMLSRLLLAKATGETVVIGYDSQGNCSNTYIRAHRVG